VLLDAQPLQTRHVVDIGVALIAAAEDVFAAAV